MALPSTNLGLSNIFYEANPLSSGINNLSLLDIASVSYFSGPNGGNAEPYNYWGESELSGVNRIYGTTARASGNNYPMGDFRGLTYYYDNSTFQVTLDVVNNLISTGPPGPPVDNDIDVTLELYDSSFVYNYLQSGSGMVSAPGSTGALQASSTSDPIIFRGYWKVKIGAMFPSFAGGTCVIKINGTTKVSAGSIPSGGGQTTFDSSTSGTQDVALYLGLTGLYFEVTVN
jgi:hypothetical protein